MTGPLLLSVLSGILIAPAISIAVHDPLYPEDVFRLFALVTIYCSPLIIIMSLIPVFIFRALRSSVNSMQSFFSLTVGSVLIPLVVFGIADLILM